MATVNDVGSVKVDSWPAALCLHLHGRFVDPIPDLLAKSVLRAFTSEMITGNSS